MAEAERGYTMNVLEKILGEIEELKRNQDSKNQDFVTGYISALSTVEGVIAGLDEAKDINVPSNDGWIPVEKKLPEEKGWYQCTCSDKDIWNEGIVRDLYYYPEIKKFVDNIRYENNGLKNIEKYYWTKYVTAWQPLPEPYRQKEQKSAKNTQLHISGNR